MVQVAESTDVELLRSAVQNLAEQHIVSAASVADRNAELPRAAMKALEDMGLARPCENDLGGQGIPGHLHWCVIAEELGKADAGTAFDLINGAYPALILDRCGTAHQRELLRPGGAPGSLRGTLLYFEGFGRSPAELATTLVPHTDRLIVSGRKNAVAHLQESSYGIVIGRLDGALAAGLLSAETLTSVTVIRDDAKSGKLGARTAHTTVIELVDAEAEPLDRGNSELARIITGFRVALASALVGIGQAAIDYAATYAASREAFGQRIADFQGVSFPLAESEFHIDGARLMLRDLAAEIDRNVDHDRLDERCGAAVAAASQAAVAAAVVAVNTLGGHGYLADHPMERYYRDATALAAVDFDPASNDWSAFR